MYAGLGIMTRSSGGKTYSEKLSTDYNRLLKYTLKQAAETAIQAKDNPFRRKYLDMTLITWGCPAPGQIDDSQGYAGHHVGHVEKGREI